VVLQANALEVEGVWDAGTGREGDAGGVGKDGAGGGAWKAWRKTKEEFEGSLSGWDSKPWAAVW